MQANRTISLGDLGLLLLLGFLWGIPYALNKITLVTIPPITMVAIRVALAAVTLWLLVVAKGCKLPDRRDFVVRLFVQGLIGCAVPYTLIAFGQRSVDSSVASVLNSTGPLFVCLIGLVGASKETPTVQRLIGVVVGLAGVIVITGKGAVSGFGHPSLGQSAILLATFSSALGAIHARRFLSLAPEVVAAGTLTSAALVLTPLALVIETPFDAAPSVPAIAALLLNAIVATALGFVVYFRLIRTLGSLGTTSVGYLRPAIGIIIGCGLLDERLTLSIALGLVFILIGVSIINLRPLAIPLPSVVIRVRDRLSAIPVATEDAGPRLGQLNKVLFDHHIGTRQ